MARFWPNHTISTESHNFSQITLFQTILTKLHTVGQIAQFWSNCTILVNLHNFDKITHFSQNCIIFATKHNLDKDVFINQSNIKITEIGGNHINI